MEAKCVAGNFNPPEEIGLSAPHKTFAVFTHSGNICDIWKEKAYWKQSVQSCVLEMHYSWCDDLYMGTKIKFVCSSVDTWVAMRLETRHGVIVID